MENNEESSCSTLIFLFVLQEEHSKPWDPRNGFGASVRPPDITYSKNEVSILISVMAVVA